MIKAIHVQHDKKKKDQIYKNMKNMSSLSVPPWSGFRSRLCPVLAHRPSIASYLTPRGLHDPSAKWRSYHPHFS